MDVLEKVRRNKDQEVVFVSRVLNPSENNPNARPGIEIHFKSRLDYQKARPIIAKLTASGIEGLTMIVDPRANLPGPGGPNDFIGVRFQYVPEIAGHADWKNTAVEIGIKLSEIAEQLRQTEGVAYAERVNYDTWVRTKNELNTATRTGNSDIGKEAWATRADRARSEAAARRVQAHGGPTDGGFPETPNVRGGSTPTERQAAAQAAARLEALKKALRKDPPPK